jgi:uncharacterized repeat protein (TIGR01451 family)
MNQSLTAPRRRSLRAFTAGLISYVLLIGPFAPLALAANQRAAHAHAKSAPATDARAGVGGESVAAEHQRAPLAAAPAPAPLAVMPNITATKVDSWDDTATPDGKADPGQTITYTVTITNNGTTDATGVVFTDSVDTNTSLVAGSVQTTPIANPDAYSALGNVRIQVPDGANDLLANDTDPDTGNNTGLTITTLAGDNSAPFAGTSANGGNVTATTGDGSFQYNPAPGFTGTDTFTYTTTDPNGGTDTATATITVKGLIWLIK